MRSEKIKTKSGLKLTIENYKKELTFFQRNFSLDPFVKSADVFLGNLKSDILSPQEEFELAKLFMSGSFPKEDSLAFRTFEAMGFCPELVIALSNAGIFSEANFHLCNNQSIGLALCLEWLGGKNLLNQETFSAFIQRTNQANPRQFDFLRGLQSLFYTLDGLGTFWDAPGRVLSIIEHPKPKMLANILERMSLRLTSEDRISEGLHNLITFENPRIIFSFINALIRVYEEKIPVTNLLIEILISPARNIIFSEQAQARVWSRIPEQRLIMIPHWEHLIDLATQNPEENTLVTMEEYVNNLLANLARGQRQLPIQVVAREQRALANPAADPLNYAQSIHAKSVEKSVSESVCKLKARYGGEKNNLKINLKRLINWVLALPDNALKNSASKSCIKRIAHKDFVYVHKDSQVSIQDLLAIIWVAIHDSRQRISSLDDAYAILVEALYEIQRGYNLSDTDVDDLKPDSSICVAGSFNKLCEKLDGIHSDVKIIFITRATATAKLPIIIREEVKLFLEKLPAAKRAECCALLKSDGTPTPIWSEIKMRVVVRVLDEFASLFDVSNDKERNILITCFENENYHSRRDELFFDFINGGLYFDLSELSCLNSPLNSPNLSESRVTLMPSPRAQGPEPAEKEEPSDDKNIGFARVNN
jgi:hypothetical protein